MANLIGQTLGQYQITALLGKGGMATVYRARQSSIGRDVAIKVIKPDLIESEEFKVRFDREAQVIAAMSHPHILKVFDYGQHGDLVYLVMELLSGGSLADLIRSAGKLPLADISRLLDQIASALDYAHRRAIVHRDLKPQNVLLDEERNAFLTDFGIAKLLSETSALTQSGMAMGTPAYMSPEQWRGQAVDARADIYALGVMLYEMLAGKVPFAGDTPYSMMHMHIFQAPPNIRSVRSDLPSAVQDVLNKSMAKDRDSRHGTAGEVAAAFKAALSGAPLSLSASSEAADVTAPVPVGAPLDAPTAQASVSAAQSVTPLSNVAEPERKAPARRLPLLLGVALLAVVGVFAALMLTGGDQRSVAQTTATSTATVVPTDAPSNTPAATALAVLPTDAPSATALVPTDTPTDAPTATALVVLPTDAPSATPTVTHTASPSATLTATQTVTSTATQTASATATQTASATATATWTASATATSTATQTASATATATFTPSVTPTATHTATRTPDLSATSAALAQRQTATARAFFANVTATLIANMTAQMQQTRLAQLQQRGTARAAASTATALAQAAPSGRIIFHTDLNGRWEINQVTLPDGAFSRLTDGRGVYYLPSFSADGSLIALSSNLSGEIEIYIMNADGTQLRSLGARGGENWGAAISPTDRQIVWHSNRGGTFRLYIADVDGKRVRQLTPRDTQGRSLDADASWAPGGRRIVFASSRTPSGLYIMDVLTGEFRHFAAAGEDAGDPAWSPDGRRIAFQSRRDGNLEIYVINLDGTGLRRLTDHPAADGRPAWSPDGQWIAFESDRDGKLDIYIMRADGSDVRRITSNAGKNGWPSWAR
jgi:tRNA A-37 threonylcarbamoyl transferase component Bud32